MIVKVKSLLQNTVLFGTFIVTISTLFASVFSYLLQLAIARLLSVEDFGTFNAFLSLAYIVNVPASVLSLSIIKMVSEFKAEDAYHKVFQSYVFISLVCAFIGSIVLLVFYFLRYVVSAYLNVQNESIVPFFGLFLALSLLVIVPQSYLQGLLRFKAYSVFIIVMGALRFLLALIAILLGFKVAGTYGAMAVAFLASFIFGFLLLKKNFTKSIEKLDLRNNYRKLVTFSGAVVFVNLGMVLLNNLDILMVKRFFNEQQAGIYSGVVTMGKFMLFGAGSVSIIMFPQISELYTKGEQYLSKFYKMLVMQIILIIAASSLFIAFPKLLVSVLFGSKFIDAVPFIPIFTVFMGIYVLINFLIMFFLAIEKTKVVLILLPMILLQFVLLNALPSTLHDVIYVDMFVAVFTVFLLIVYFLLTTKNGKGNLLK